VTAEQRIADECLALSEPRRDTTSRFLRRAVHDPRRAAHVGLALARGHWYKLVYPLLGRRFRAGRGLRVYGRLTVRGPGEVVFGERVTVHGHARPWTYAHDARIVIGDDVMMGDTAFACAQEITVGHQCILGSASVQDTDFHSTRADRRSSSAPIRIAPVHIGDNVWIAQSAGILPGTTIGRNSIVSFGSVCRRDVPENAILMGNPAKVVAPVPSAAAAPEIASSVDTPARPSGSIGPAVSTRIGRILPTLSILILQACGDQMTTNAKAATISSIHADTNWQRLKARKIFFGHQSVGANILQGVREIMEADSTLSLRLVQSAEPASVSGPALVEALVGENGDPSSKSRAFARALADGLGESGGIALLKYCYVDVRPGSDARHIFAEYRATVDALKSRHPEISFVHVTMPLTTVESWPKRLARRALGKTTQLELNATRNAYNTLLRRTYAGTAPIFDLAAIESTHSDGSRSFITTGADTVYTLAPEWTDDGGHLNAAARYRAARGFLNVLASL
jgi:acetyltransferase-like isoleucine patch superfamily enzyme